MVNQLHPSLDRTFAALADPTRRAIVARLGAEEAVTVSEIARPFAMSLPAVMKHLDVLGEAGLVSRTKVGRTVTCRLEAEPMREAMAWLERYERFWTASLDRLVALVEADAAEERAGAVGATGRSVDAPGERRQGEPGERPQGEPGERRHEQPGERRQEDEP